MAGPNSYDPEKDDKRKGLKVIDIDCRGLEFTEFKPEVGFPPLIWLPKLIEHRANGRPKASNPRHHLPALTYPKGNGMIMTRRLVRRSASMSLSGKLGGPEAFIRLFCAVLLYA